MVNPVDNRLGASWDSYWTPLCKPTDLAIEVITGGLRLTWTPCAGAETELYVSIDGGAYALITTLGLTVGTYDYACESDGFDYAFKARSKYDVTSLNAPSDFTVMAIAGGNLLTWSDNNTEAELIEVYANINGAGYSLLTTLADGVQTYSHTVSYTTALYKLRAKEGTLPVYSSYSSERSPISLTGLIADANKDKVVLTFNQTLDTGITPSTSAFALAGKTITAVDVASSTVTLTVSVDYAGGDTVTCVYTRPISNPLTTSTDGVVGSFTQSINNLIVPATLTDTSKTVGWYVADDTSSLTKDTGATEEVTQWNDKSGSAHHLVDPGATKRPVWSANGILFDGANDYMKANTFTYAQPEFIYMVVKNVTYGTSDYMFDGNTGQKGYVLLSPATPQIKGAVANSSAGNSNLAVNTWGILRVRFNGANSKLQVNETAATTWDCGAGNMAGFTLGAYGGGAGVWSNIQVKEVVLRKVDDGVAADEATIYNYLKSKYGL